MTQLENFRATVLHEPHPEFLFYASFTPDMAKRLRDKCGLSEDGDLAAFFGMYNPVGVRPYELEVKTKSDFSKYFSDVDKPEGSFINGIGVLEVPAHFHHFTGYVSPLRNAKKFSEIEEFPFPPSEGFSAAGMKEKVEQAHKEGRVASTWVGHMYENAWQVRGHEEFLFDTVDNPEWCEYIPDRFMEKNLNVSVLAAKAGVDIITTGDDVANQNSLMFSRPMWRP